MRPFLSIRQISFRVFGEGAKIKSEYYLLSSIRIKRGMSLKFDYLGEFEFIFENNLGLNQGSSRALLIKDVKISWECTFNSINLNFLRWPGQVLQ